MTSNTITSTGALLFVSNPYDNNAFAHAQSLVQQNVDVVVFLYGDGAHLARLAWQPADAPNPQADWQALGVPLYVCVQSALVRGVCDDDNHARTNLPINIAQGFSLVGLGTLFELAQSRNFIAYSQKIATIQPQNSIGIMLQSPIELICYEALALGLALASFGMLVHFIIDAPACVCLAPISHTSTHHNRVQKMLHSLDWYDIAPPFATAAALPLLIDAMPAITWADFGGQAVDIVL